MTFILLILIGLFNAISEASNQSKLQSVNGWGKWFDENSWMNKNTWKPILGFIKWSWWPFIVFTDAFHFFKSCWVICVCLLPIFAPIELSQNMAILICIYFATYSTSFEIIYSILPYLKFKK